MNYILNKIFKSKMEVYNLCDNSIQLLEIILKMVEENNL